MTQPIVAIDGPSGAGKSTVSKMVARSLGFIYVDTGALYRSVAWAARQQNIAFDDDVALGKLVQQINISFRMDGDINRIFVDDTDVTDAIRTPENSMAASAVSARKTVRDGLMDLQRRQGKNGGVVLEGRDIGTVVFPNAEVKIFLTASNAERARRRHAELMAKGDTTSYQEILEQIETRDRNDSQRDVAPLKKADDAIELETTAMSIDEVVAAIAHQVEQCQ